MTKEDANTTPKLEKKKGNPQEVPPGRNIPTLQANCLLITKYYISRILSRIIYPKRAKIIPRMPKTVNSLRVRPCKKTRENLNKYELGEMTREEYLAATDELFGEANQEFGKMGWNYFKSYFTDGVHTYEADISVAKTKEQSVVYNIGYIKNGGKLEEKNKSSHSLTGSPNELVTILANEASNRNSNNKIPHIEDSVKNNVSEEGEDYPIPATSNFEELLEAYENGEISRQEYLDALKKEKNLNPKEIADLTEEDANTTHKLKKQEGNPREVPPGRNIPTLQANCFQTIKYHKKKFMSRIKLKIDNILPHAKALQKLLVNL